MIEKQIYDRSVAKLPIYIAVLQSILLKYINIVKRYKYILEHKYSLLITKYFKYAVFKYIHDNFNLVM